MRSNSRGRAARASKPPSSWLDHLDGPPDSHWQGSDFKSKLSTVVALSKMRSGVANRDRGAAEADVERAFDMRGDDILLLLLLVGTIGFFSRADMNGVSLPLRLPRPPSSPRSILATGGPFARVYYATGIRFANGQKKGAQIRRCTSGRRH